MDCKSSPKWLNSEFLISCLKEKEKDLTGEIGFTVEEAVAAGNNFFGSVLRVNIKSSVERETKTTSLIIKYPPEGKETQELTNLVGKKEGMFYNLILPEIRKFYNLTISPETYPSPIQTILVMEDLKASGHKMKDRRTLLDFEHCKLFIEALGKLHACGMVAIKKNPSLVDSIGPHMILMLGQIKEEKEKSVWKFAVRDAMKFVSSTIENHEEYKEENEVIESAADSLWDLIISFLKLPNTYKTIIHGDCWTTNAMFKYDEAGNTVSVKTFDFQCCSFSPAVIDLVYFIWLSSNNDVRENRLDELYHLYCDTLNSTLQQLGSDVTLTFSRLKEEILLASPVILYCVAFRLPAHLFDGVYDMDVLKKEVSDGCNNVGKRFHQGKFYSKVFPHILKQMKREGVFDYLKKLL